MLLQEYVEYMGYLWLVVALFFLFAELQTPGLFFFVSFTIGALGAAILAFLGYSLIVQCVAGLVISIAAFLIMRKFLKKIKMSEVRYDRSHTNIDALVGKSGIVVKSIRPHAVGQVKIGGEVWRARSDSDLEKGVEVKVLRVEGNTVVVKNYKEGK